jgi:hypothetical protein
MQRNEFTAEEILSWRDAFWDRNRLNALVGDQAVDTPFRAVEGIFRDLEPATSYSRVGLRVSDLFEVRHDGTFVRRLDDVRGPGGEGVAPCESSRGAGLHGNDGVGFCGWVGAAVAYYVVCCYIVDGLGMVLIGWYQEEGRGRARGRTPS